MAKRATKKAASAKSEDGSQNGSGVTTEARIASRGILCAAERPGGGLACLLAPSHRHARLARSVAR